MACQPIVSCVMPTRNRRRFVQQALGYFARQTFASREMIVVDDSDDPVEDLCAGVPTVRYFRIAPGQLSLGGKLNYGIAQASGEFLIKWDDDDWYHPGFVSTMLDALWSAPQPNQVVAACGCYLVYIAGERCFRFSGRMRGAGGTLTFSKSHWRSMPFRDLPTAEDYWFLMDSRNPIVIVDDSELYVRIRHGRNTWVKSRDGRVTDRIFRSLPEVSENLLRLFSPEEEAFYFSLPPVKEVARRSRAARLSAALRAPSE